MSAHAYDWREDFGLRPCPECNNTTCQCPVEEPPRITGADLDGHTIHGIRFVRGETIDLDALEPLHGPEPFPPAEEAP